MANYQKAYQINEQIKALMLERGMKVKENRTSQQLEQDLLDACKKIKVKTKSLE